MAKIFISYAHEDIEAARRLFLELSSLPDMHPWFDKESLRVGMRWEPAIRKAIRESDYFLALLSQHSTSKRGYVNREMKMALEILDEFPEDRSFLLPIRLDDCQPSFEALRGINYVDFFPCWDDGFQKVVSVISPRPITGPAIAVESYEYTCALIDLDSGLTSSLKRIVQTLNSIQRFFYFSVPPVQLSNEGIRYVYGSLNVALVPKKIIEQRQSLNVDLMICLTRYALAFAEGENALYNCFSGPSTTDEAFMFVSTDRLDDFTRKSNRTFAKGIVYIILSQLIGYFTNLGYHQETRGCIMDFCNNRVDMIIGLKRLRLCEGCLTEIKNRYLQSAIESILLNELDDRT